MAPSQKATNKRLAILTMVRDNKNLLFGKFSNKLTDQMKERCWKDILEKAQSLGFITAERDWIYLRDSVYGNWKSRCLKKVDNTKKTGTGGGKAIQLDQGDEIILDIIGKNTPTIVGLPLAESMDQVPCSSSSIVSAEASQVLSAQATATDQSEAPNSKANTLGNEKTKDVEDEKEKCRNSKKKKPRIEEELKSQLLKKRKLQLKILEKEDYLSTLRIMDMEQKLGIPRSKYSTIEDTSTDDQD